MGNDSLGHIVSTVCIVPGGHSGHSTISSANVALESSPDKKSKGIYFLHRERLGRLLNR